MSAHLDPRLVAPPGAWEDATGAERATALDHIASCTPCRDLLLAADSSAVFGLLAAEPLPAWVLDSVSAGVEAALDERKTRFLRPAAAAPLPWTRLAAAWAAAVLLAALSSLYLLRPDRVTPSSSPLALAGVEVMETPSAARVLDLTVGDTQVVMIFDEGIEL